MTDTTNGVPDLLLRFVETPFSTTISVHDAEIALRSNARLEPNCAPVPTCPVVDKLSATIVFDKEAPSDDSTVTLIKTYPVATILVGAGTVLALDCERAEILGFVASEIPPARLASELLPIVVDLYRDLRSHFGDRQRPI